MNTTAYILVTTFAFLLLAIVWKKGDLLNFVIKTALYILAINGGYLVFTRHLLG